MLKRHLNLVLDLLFPPLCIVCNNALINQEEQLCVTCLTNLPYLTVLEQSKVEQLFWGIIKLESAIALIHYTKDSPYTQIIKELKYNNNKSIAPFIGTLLSTKIIKEHRKHPIDALIPVPLHKEKYNKRGFNQAELIAKEISRHTGIPVVLNVLEKTENKESQTNKKKYQRWENSVSTYKVNPTSNLENKHILLIDDVLTTGATLASCAKELIETSQCKVSIATFAISDG